MTGSTIIPSIRYDDAPSMIDWLCEASGFARHLVVEDGADGIAHAQLTLSDALIMLGSDSDNDLGLVRLTARALGGISRSAYVVVADVDALCERARAAGTKITVEPKGEEYSGRGFICVDPEGQLWNSGTYDPWRSEG